MHWQRQRRHCRPQPDFASDDKRFDHHVFAPSMGAPMILRLYGQGRSLMRGTPEYADLVPKFEEVPGRARSYACRFDLVQTSCGMGVPLFDYKQGAWQPRALLDGAGRQQSAKILGSERT